MPPRPPLYEGDGSVLLELGGLLSRALNLATGGKGSGRVTFSARCGWDAAWGRRAWLAGLVDRLAREPGHCARWAAWHAARGLLPPLPGG